MIETVVLSAPGIYRREWLSFLKSVPALHLAAITETLPDFLAAARAFRPGLAILDETVFGDGGPAMLAGLRDEEIVAGCLILVENLQQLQQAADMGCGHALLRGFAAREFFEHLSSLCPGKVDEVPADAAATRTEAGP
jgi:hypothetical protein